MAQGSPQFFLHQASSRLQHLQFARKEMGRRQEKTVSFVLGSADGKSTKTLALPVASQRPGNRKFRPRGHEILEGNVGYLRIPSMGSGPDFRDWLHQAMVQLARTKGLIVDVRNNGGGSRESLRTLFPYFMAPSDPPHVANVAAYRLRPRDRPNDPEGYLANRFLYPAGWKGWSSEARKSIAEAARTFRPDWKLPPGEFSDWHYMVLERGDIPQHYGRPVVILMDAGCFSATDIFLGGFKGWRNVTLLGTASGGGSGRSQSYTLHHSGLRFRLSSMASFLPNGSRYDGKGIVPDVVVDPALTDLTGQTDTVLETARRRLLQ